MLRRLAISALSFVGVVSVASADVFRWVDDHGGVHYSDQWVPGSEVIKSSGTKPHPTSTSADTAQRTPEQQRINAANERIAAQGTQQDAAKAVQQDVTKVREQQCKEAKDRYDKAIQARHIYKSSGSDKSKDTDRPDDRQYLSDEEADAYRVKARTQVQEFCGNAATKQSDGT
jgi:Domain of unknown function (DUF4124)